MEKIDSKSAALGLAVGATVFFCVMAGFGLSESRLESLHNNTKKRLSSITDMCNKQPKAAMVRECYTANLDAIASTEDALIIVPDREVKE